MKKIDTCRNLPYSPLIPALQAFFTAEKGEQLEIKTTDLAVFNDLKEFLSEQHIGFREIYENEHMSLQFTIPIQ